MAFISYAQNYEDVMLWRALKDVPQGFYIDVGAQDPDVDSVTRAFYDNGWSGINIEPVTKYHELLCQARSRDINLCVAVGAEETEREFFEIPDTGLSTFDPQIAARHHDAGWTASPRRVAQRRLADIWTECVKGQVHFLKIDAEGSEPEVLAGAGLNQHRPWIIVVEAVAPLTQAPEHEKWERLITDAGYAFVYFDGMNRFYLAREKAELKPRFAVPPNFFDDFVRASESIALRELANLRGGSAHAAAPDDLDARLTRIEAAVTNLSKNLQDVAQKQAQAASDIICSQVAYLGDHRALTYLPTGQKLFVDTRSIDIGTHLMLSGQWEPNYAIAFCKLLKSGDIVLDIGANHGFYTVIAGPYILPNGHVYAFEPSKKFYELIKASIFVNGLDQVATVERLAVGDLARDVALVSDAYWSGGGHISVDSQPVGGLYPSGEVESETVHCVSLDEHFGDRLAKIDVIKMDIEGAEGLALKGMSKLIDRSPGLKIMMEFCPTMLDHFECNARFVLDFFASRGFMCWTINVDASLAPQRWETLLEKPDLIRNIMISRRALG